ncbi:hypothetical protein Patl1_26789 [Pistacia atlantica]|uniref:Uncharacterized protein n=2 Tax=Pistacia atlantica TaxID=434234 RepID=A0ACC1B1E9_9ROSI|nr:hypothetical protein Patl1_13352 [Pistacia atlantica]KAJ0092716.1 hypothetical protein Patl1_26789 [Pistacia atlantica]
MHNIEKKIEKRKLDHTTNKRPSKRADHTTNKNVSFFQAKNTQNRTLLFVNHTNQSHQIDWISLYQINSIQHKCKSNTFIQQKK